MDPPESPEPVPGPDPKPCEPPPLGGEGGFGALDVGPIDVAGGVAGAAGGALYEGDDVPVSGAGGAAVCAGASGGGAADVFVSAATTGFCAGADGAGDAAGSLPVNAAIAWDVRCERSTAPAFVAGKLPALSSTTTSCDADCVAARTCLSGNTRCTTE